MPRTGSRSRAPSLSSVIRAGQVTGPICRWQFPVRLGAAEGRHPRPGRIGLLSSRTCLGAPVAELRIERFVRVYEPNHPSAPAVSVDAPRWHPGAVGAPDGVGDRAQ